MTAVSYVVSQESLCCAHTCKPPAELWTSSLTIQYSRPAIPANTLVQCAALFSPIGPHASADNTTQSHYSSDTAARPPLACLQKVRFKPESCFDSDRCAAVARYTGLHNDMHPSCPAPVLVTLSKFIQWTFCSLQPCNLISFIYLIQTTKIHRNITVKYDNDRNTQTTQNENKQTKQKIK